MFRYDDLHPKRNNLLWDLKGLSIVGLIHFWMLRYCSIKSFLLFVKLCLVPAAPRCFTPSMSFDMASSLVFWLFSSGGAHSSPIEHCRLLISSCHIFGIMAITINVMIIVPLTRIQFPDSGRSLWPVLRRIQHRRTFTRSGVRALIRSERCYSRRDFPGRRSTVEEGHHGQGD